MGEGETNLHFNNSHRTHYWQLPDHRILFDLCRAKYLIERCLFEFQTVSFRFRMYYLKYLVIFWSDKGLINLNLIYIRVTSKNINL